MKQVIRIGTRTSKLAMAQTHIIIRKIKKVYPEMNFEIVPIKTVGDRILDRSLLSFGGKGAFVLEFEEALLRGDIDLAVHSAKDMPMSLEEGLAIVAIPKREDPRDVLITLKDIPLKDGAIIGTSSLRRQYQIASQRKVICKDLRGNVNTRLEKLEAGEYDGIILAAAGLKRLGLTCEEHFHYDYMDCHTFIPAAGQGIIAVEGRKDDELIPIVSVINDQDTVIALNIERYVLQLLNAGCHEPIGVYSYITNDKLHLILLKAESNKIIRKKGSCNIEEGKNLAKVLVGEIKESVMEMM